MTCCLICSSKQTLQGVSSRLSFGPFWHVKLLNGLLTLDFEPFWFCISRMRFNYLRLPQSHCLRMLPVWPTFLPLLVRYWPMEVGAVIAQLSASRPSILWVSRFSQLEHSYIPTNRLTLIQQALNYPSRNCFKSELQPLLDCSLSASEQVVSSLVSVPLGQIKWPLRLLRMGTIRSTMDLTMTLQSMKLMKNQVQASKSKHFLLTFTFVSILEL
mmetsp:Transcript_34953/g.84570  ORF Transcript_34953/g.84570 Transcript_34953/m.84570 type:complete len:214 (+) Transcript_34953:260-901(+)